MDDQEQQQGEREPRISSTSAALMVATALLFDVISIIPVVGQAIADVGSFVVFLIWFLILGLPLVSPKKLLTTLVAYIIEFIPAISALPAITAGVIIMIVISRAEDKTGIQLLDKKGAPNLKNIAGAGGSIKALGSAVVKKTPTRMDDLLPSST